MEEAHTLVVKASDSQSAGRVFESRRRRLFSHISLRQVDHSSLPRPAKPSVNWCQLRLGLKSFVRLQGRLMARLAAGVGVMGLTCRTPRCALIYLPFLPVRLYPTLTFDFDYKMCMIDWMIGEVIGMESCFIVATLGVALPRGGTYNVCVTLVFFSTFFRRVRHTHRSNGSTEKHARWLKRCWLAQRYMPPCWHQKCTSASSPPFPTKNRKPPISTMTNFLM